MKRTVIFIIAIIFLAACGHTEIQKEYMKAQKKIAELKEQRANDPLAEIETPDGYVMRVKDPRRADVEIDAPQRHPAEAVWSDTVSLASSPLASVLGFGFATQMILDEATGDVIGSNNEASGDQAIDTGTGDAGLEKTDYNNDKSDNSDNRQNYDNDQSDHSDNRQNYNNDKSDNSDDRQNYNNELKDKESE